MGCSRVAQERSNNEPSIGEQKNVVIYPAITLSCDTCWREDSYKRGNNE